MFFRLAKVFRQGLPCLFHLITGLYCPGCGGTRAVKYLLDGNIGKSIQYHPLVFYMVLVAALEGLGLGVETLAKRPRPHYRRCEIWLYIGIAVILVNWGVKNYMLAVRGLDLLP